MNDVIKTLNNYEDALEEAYNNGELYDYISDHALDIDIVISSSGEYRGVEFLLSFGDPNVSVNRYGSLVCAWGGKNADRMIDSNIAAELDMIGEEIYSSIIPSRPGMRSPGRSMRSASRLSSRRTIDRPTSSLRSTTRSSDLRRKKKIK